MSTQLLGRDNQITKENGLIERFQGQLNNVEQLMNASMRPLMQELPLSDIGSRQALETLERWSELYRHGLKAAGNISERGEEWLLEAYQRLSLTADLLRKLDVKNEAQATRDREAKAKELVKTIKKIGVLILPICP
jgi:hypothetical protein